MGRFGDCHSRLSARDNVLETYVLTAPIFYFGEKVESLGDDCNDAIPIPHAFIKSVLAEAQDGGFSLWTFLMKNEQQNDELKDYLIPTDHAERLVGGIFWNRIQAQDLELKKSQPGKMW